MRQRGELVPIGDALSGMGGPVKAIREATPQAVHHFTLADQVNQLVSASEADPDRGFMARMMALCSLPRTNPGNRKEYKRVNGPFTLIMFSSSASKLPFGNLPRLLLAWVCTEAVRTQSRVLILGSSLSDFMDSPFPGPSALTLAVGLRQESTRGPPPAERTPSWDARAAAVSGRLEVAPHSGSLGGRCTASSACTRTRPATR